MTKKQPTKEEREFEVLLGRIPPSPRRGERIDLAEYKAAGKASDEDTIRCTGCDGTGDWNRLKPGCRLDECSSCNGTGVLTFGVLQRRGTKYSMERAKLAYTLTVAQARVAELEAEETRLHVEVRDTLDVVTEYTEHILSLEADLVRLRETESKAVKALAGKMGDNALLVLERDAALAEARQDTLTAHMYKCAGCGHLCYLRAWSKKHEGFVCASCSDTEHARLERPDA